MKYLFLIFVMLIGFDANGQCSEFDNLLKKGDNYLKGNKPNYQEAINAYTAAILACSDRAEEAKRRIAEMVNDINKLKESALVSENKAKKATVEAEIQRDKARTALASLEKSNIEVVKLILKNAERDILNLWYEEALEKIKTASRIGSQKPEVTKAWLEVVFWYGEMGDTLRAAALLDSVAKFANKNLTFLHPFRASIEAFDPDEYKKIMKRYYPEMVEVRGWIFNMGCNGSIDPDCQGDETFRKQEVFSFEIAKSETTWWQYLLFCKATGHKYEPPSWGIDGDNPAVNVSWHDAVKYTKWINSQFGVIDFRLPTEAEWEYAAKGGLNYSPFIYSGGNSLDSVGWFSENSRNRTNPVGKKAANALGLNDMSGNAREWCWDLYGPYPEYIPGTFYNGYSGPNRGAYRVIRGGSWNKNATFCRVSNRDFGPYDRDPSYGFRISRGKKIETAGR